MNFNQSSVMSLKPPELNFLVKLKKAKHMVMFFDKRYLCYFSLYTIIDKEEKLT